MPQWAYIRTRVAEQKQQEVYETERITQHDPCEIKIKNQRQFNGFVQWQSRNEILQTINGIQDKKKIQR